MEIHTPVITSAMPRVVAGIGHFAAISIKRLQLTALALATMALLLLVGVSWAQEVPELDLSTPSGRLSTGIPAAILIPIRNESLPNSNGGWVLVYRNLVRGAQTPNADIHSRSVDVPGSMKEAVITWEITHTVNNKCTDAVEGCPDQIRVLSVPEGYVAVPQSAQVNEREGLRVLIIPIVVG